MVHSTDKPLAEPIARAKTAFLHARARMEKALATTPDDKLYWSPSPTSRSIIQLVTHSAQAVHAMKETFDGRTLGIASPEEADRYFREKDCEPCDREQSLAMLARNSEEFVGWLEGLDPNRLDEMVKLPFNLGEAPLAVCLTFMPSHLDSHTSQIEYVQTIYGDRDWYL